MTGPDPLSQLLAGGTGRWVLGGLTAACAGWLLLADYHPLALAVLVTLFFGAYVAFRWIWWMDDNRMTPKRLQVGLIWALMGYNHDNEEVDLGPVRVFFILLAVQFAGLVLRPILQWTVL